MCAWRCWALSSAPLCVVPAPGVCEVVVCPNECRDLGVGEEPPVQCLPLPPTGRLRLGVGCDGLPLAARESGHRLTHLGVPIGEPEGSRARLGGQLVEGLAHRGGDDDRPEQPPSGYVVPPIAVPAHRGHDAVNVDDQSLGPGHIPRYTRTIVHWP
jgi:hypothetical protein